MRRVVFLIVGWITNVSWIVSGYRMFFLRHFQLSKHSLKLFVHIQNIISTSMYRRLSSSRGRFVWIAGGMRNNNISTKGLGGRTRLRNSAAQDESQAEKNKLSLLIDREEKRCPRLWNTVFVIIVPLLFLIGWAMLCGHFLAVVERDDEMKSNDSAILSFFIEDQKLQQSLDTVKNSYEECLTAFVDSSTSELVNSTELKSYMIECTAEGVSESQLLVNGISNSTAAGLFTGGMSFEWNTCTEKGNWGNSDEQGIFVFGEWKKSFFTLFEDYVSTGLDEGEAYLLATEKATGMDNCKVNSAGGAVFWFTIMT